MALTKKSLVLCIQALGDRLYDSNPTIRGKAAQSLAELADEAVIPLLCKALDQESNPDVACQIMDAIVLINKSLNPKTMSDSPKYDLRGAKIGNFAETVHGDQKSVQHNYAEQPSLAETVQEIQALLDQLSKTYPTTTLDEKEKLADVAIAQIDTNPPLKAKLIAVMRAMGFETVKQAINHPVAEIFMAGIEAWTEQ